MKHTDQVKGITITNQKLAENIGDLYYNSLAAFLLDLSEKIQADADKDHARGRTKLSGNLYECAAQLKTAAQAAERAWTICEPFINKWEKSHENDKIPEQ